MDFKSAIGSLPVPPTFTARSRATYLVILNCIMRISASWYEAAAPPTFFFGWGTPHTPSRLTAPPLSRQASGKSKRFTFASFGDAYARQIAAHPDDGCLVLRRHVRP